jgi:hypothetical protein
VFRPRRINRTNRRTNRDNANRRCVFASWRIFSQNASMELTLHDLHYCTAFSLKGLYETDTLMHSNFSGTLLAPQGRNS